MEPVTVRARSSRLRKECRIIPAQPVTEAEGGRESLQGAAAGAAQENQTAKAGVQP